MPQLIYAGIGSRETPLNVLEQMGHIARTLGTVGWALRSGGADGADTAFHYGARTVSRNMEIYLPWNGFNKLHAYQDNEFIVPTDAQFSQAMLIAKSFHPAWHRCSQAAQKLHARNAFQVLGLGLDTPATCIVCWTKDGKASGGTGQALRMAEYYEVPVFNLFYGEETLSKLSDFCTEAEIRKETQTNEQPSPAL